jgi:hypothetical protein
VTIRFSYYADLGSIQLDESGRGWIQAMRVGSYEHPRYGKLEFTLERLQRFAESVKRKVRGIDPDIDYDHKMDPARGREAAGWVKDAKVDGNALWLLVEWTKTAADKIKEKAYRYFSPEFQTEWKDPQGNVHKDVLFGGGITNRPFLKDLLPLNLSELSFAEPNAEEKKLDPKELRKVLGLPEDASDEQVMERVQQNTQAAQRAGGTVNPDRLATTHAPNTPATSSPTVPGGPNDDQKREGEQPPSGAPHPASFPQQHQASLSELMADPKIVLLMEHIVKPLQAQLSELQQANVASGIEVKLSEFNTGNKILAPAVVNEFREVLKKTPVELHESIYAVMRKLRDGHGVVQLGETGGTAQPGMVLYEGKSPMDIVDERVTKKLSENKDMDRVDALSQVFAEDPQLFTAYQEASYAFKA